MGGRTAGAIAERMIGHGLASETPVAIATSISRPDQKILRSTLGALSAAIEAIDPGKPVVIGVGKVFGLAAGVRKNTAAA